MSESERICQLEAQLEAVQNELKECQALLVSYGQKLTAAHVALTIIMDHSLEDNYLHKVAAKALGQREPS